MFKILLAAAGFACAGLAGGTAVSAQGVAAACAGQLVGMRVSSLKPGGSMAGFAEAVRDNAAWYAGHGLKNDRFSVAPVLEPADKTYKPSVTKVMTIHVYGSAETPRKDAAWEAFVAKYQANSKIDSSVVVCLPKGALTLK